MQLLPVLNLKILLLSLKLLHHWVLRQHYRCLLPETLFQLLQILLEYFLPNLDFNSSDPRDPSAFQAISPLFSPISSNLNLFPLLAVSIVIKLC